MIRNNGRPIVVSAPHVPIDGRGMTTVVDSGPEYEIIYRPVPRCNLTLKEEFKLRYADLDELREDIRNKYVHYVELNNPAYHDIKVMLLDFKKRLDRIL
jgi:hypothetical protein